MRPLTCTSIEKALNNMYYCEDYSWIHNAFKDRLEAGLILSKFITQVLENPGDIIVGLAAGGIPVAYIISKELRLPLDILVVKKITYPWTTEAGYGAVAPDGTYIYDVEAATRIGYNKEHVEKEAGKIHEYVVTRTLKLRGSLDYKNIQGRNVILVDDGIATGYTVIAAIRFLKRNKATKIIVATPTASLDGARTVARETDNLLVLNLRTGPFYAVAEAYKEWHDVSDEEALEYIKTAREHLKTQKAESKEKGAKGPVV